MIYNIYFFFLWFKEFYYILGRLSLSAMIENGFLGKKVKQTNIGLHLNVHMAAQ